MKAFFLSISLVVITFFHCAAQDSLSILFAGDIMGHDSQINSAYNASTKQYNYDENFKYLLPYFENTDLVIGNLEVTLGNTPYKGYPSFSSPMALATSLKKAGLDVLVTANNHSCDRRKKGIYSTIDILDSLKIQHTGTFKNQAEKDNHYPLLLSKNGFKIALLNYTYGTNGIPVDPPAIVNKIDNEQMALDIEKAKKLSPDKIIVFIHWGKEYQQLPSKEQKGVAQYLFSKGADVVIGSHPHVIQPMEMIPSEIEGDNKFIAYSLGNFISNQRKINTDGGAMVRLTFVKSQDQVVLQHSEHILTWVYTPIQKGKKHFYILPTKDFESNFDFFPGIADYKKMKLFVKQARLLLDKHNINVPEKVD